MRITTYDTHIIENKPTLVKQNSNNYPSIKKLDSPKNVTSMMNDIFCANILTEEHVWVIALNTKLIPIGVFEISHGLVDSSIISPREIFMKLCLCNAYGFILVHNHPSEDCEPSPEDIEITKDLTKCGEIMNINLLDHIIIGGENYYSIKQH